MRIELQGIHKHFGAVRANDGISMDIPEGSIHGILGENGAGKSTLMKVLSGYMERTSGAILVNGRPVELQGPSQATALGIGMLYQDPLDFPPLSVLENFAAGLTHGFTLDRARLRKQLLDSSRHFGFSLDPDSELRSLTVGERQQLEMVRLLVLGVEVLILDEPTTGISSLQKQVLFGALRRLAEQGKTILLVSHK
ncbi:MAG: ATP-binding cassette domain-containing protein, partial [Deltaproteobacteria bacterium]|nr:ATP-binding cassette domain-containing protein [Deltaproteobacteria bacterium]